MLKSLFKCELMNANSAWCIFWKRGLDLQIYTYMGKRWVGKFRKHDFGNKKKKAFAAEKYFSTHGMVPVG